MQSKQGQLELLHKKMLACSKCVLRTNCNQVVPGAGRSTAEIMFIGEAPGKKEDGLGVPFVGAAGKFLDKMLASIKLNRENVYIANTVKCRPPENRDPSPEEMAICWPWLEKQIALIKPLLIITLGRHSMARFFPGQKISQIHGTILTRTMPKIGKQNFYILYHPAAALYNGSLRETLLKDFSKIPKILTATKKSS